MSSSSSTLLLSLVISVLIHESVLLSPEDEDWIDPFDMVNFDPSAVKMTDHPQKTDDEASLGRKKEGMEIEVIPEPVKLSGGLLDADLDNQNDLDRAHPSTTGSPHKDHGTEHGEITQTKPVSQKPADNSSVYRTLYRKHVKMLLEKWDSKAGEGGVVMIVSLSDHDVNLLRTFASLGEGQIFDINEILQKMIVRVEYPYSSYSERSFPENFAGISLQTVIQILAILALLSVILWVEVTLNVAWRKKLVKLTFLLFFISVPWTWYHMYKLEEAKRQTELMKDVPEVCIKRKLSWYEMAAEVARSTLTLSEDQCVKYYEQMLVDPVWKVTPTEAFAVTFVKFFVSPAKHIGQGISEFVKGTFQHLPVTLWPIVLICGMVITVLILLFSFGVSIRLPFVSIQCGNSSRLAAVTSENSQQKKEIEALCSKLEQSERQRLALTTGQVAHSASSLPIPTVPSVQQSVHKSQVALCSGEPLKLVRIQDVQMQAVHRDPTAVVSPENLIHDKSDTHGTSKHISVSDIVDFSSGDTPKFSAGARMGYCDEVQAKHHPAISDVNCSAGNQVKHHPAIFDVNCSAGDQVKTPSAIPDVNCSAGDQVKTPSAIPDVNCSAGDQVKTPSAIPDVNCSAGDQVKTPSAIPDVNCSAGDQVKTPSAIPDVNCSAGDQVKPSSAIPGVNCSAGDQVKHLHAEADFQKPPEYSGIEDIPVVKSKN